MSSSATSITIMLTDILTYDFMQRAFAASGIVAFVAGTVGYFLVLRGQAFAGHALSHVGFAGATGAALLGLSPLGGMVVFTVAAGIGMGILGERLAGRDVAIGIILALALGLGLLFLNLYSSNAAQATSLLFGNVLAVSSAMLNGLALLAIVTLVALAAISRPLLFASLQPELAEAKGVPLRTVGALFMAVVALAVAQSVQIVGVLLVFALMVAPPATAQLVTNRLFPGIGLAAGLAVMQAWLGIVIAYMTDWPTSFCITALGALIYLAALAAAGHRHRR
jgi:zinc/manganese transport system permease protein